MRELAKMVTGLVAKTSADPWLRAVLFASMAMGVWQLWLRIVGHVCDSSLDFIILPAIGLAIMSFVVLLICTIEGNLLERGLWGTAQRLPLMLLAEMTDDGEDVRLWVILIWPFLVPAELAVCVGTAIAVVIYGVSRILNIKLK